VAYPIRPPELVVDPNQSATIPFRPAAAGLVNVIVTAVGLQLATDGGGTDGGGGKSGQPPAQSHFASFTTALRLDILKPGAAMPAASTTGFLNITGPEQQNRLVVFVTAMAAAADLSADWTAKITNTAAGNAQAKYQLATARCNATVRYQVTPGNLGKIDHIVVLMLENRSFDHMLGYLGLEGGRADVDGLKGTEVNFDSAGNPHPVFHRLAPLPGQSTTSFLNDPGHGWGDVADQLGPDAAHATADQPLDSNAGFVRNFELQLSKDANDPNLPPLTHQVHDSGQIAGGDSRTISFRPAQPGRVSVGSVASSPPKRSDSGLLGSITLHRPGSTAPVATASAEIGGDTISLSHQATAAELANPGNWTCEVFNGTDAALTFATGISYVQQVHNTSNFEKPAAVMGYYNKSQLPAYDLLANSFAICDRWYASLPTDTWPNRLYALTGGSGGMTDTPSDASVEQDPPGYTLKTIFEVLQEHQVDDWQIFFSDLPFALIFKNLVQDAAYTSRMRSVADLYERAKTGDLPSFSWVDPNFTDVPDDKSAASDDHPPGDISRGQRLVSQLYDALSKSPAWPKTLLIITYDEHGGFFDHVLPPGHRTAVTNVPPVAARPAAAGPGVVGTAEPTAPPDDNPQLRVYGLRVPSFVVSPWVVPKSVSKLVYDHTSLLSTVLHRFCADANGNVPSMGKRTDAAQHIAPMLSAATPALNPPQVPGVQATAVNGAVLDRNTFGNVLHKSVFRF
jgi:phospholipase C